MQAKILRQKQLGVTGVQAAIVMIAFVTVASVFAYSALRWGVFEEENDEQTIMVELTQDGPDYILSVPVGGHGIFTENDYTATVSGGIVVPQTMVLVKPHDEAGCVYVLLLNEPRHQQLQDLWHHTLEAVPGDFVRLGPFSCGVTLVRWK